MRRYSDPNATTAGSGLKNPTIAAGATWHSTVNTSITATLMPAAARNASRTRSPSRAPKFWPATGAVANAIATAGRNSACIRRTPMPNPAWAGVPK